MVCCWFVVCFWFFFFEHQPLCCCDLKLIWLPNLVTDFKFSFGCVRAVGSNHVYAIVSLVSSSLAGFCISPLGHGKAFYSVAVCSQELLAGCAQPPSFLKIRRASRDATIVLHHFAELFARDGKILFFFPRDVGARLLQTPGDVDGFRSSVQSPGQGGGCSSGPVRAWREGGKRPRFEARQGFFSPFEPVGFFILR